MPARGTIWSRIRAPDRPGPLPLPSLVSNNVSACLLASQRLQQQELTLAVVVATVGQGREDGNLKKDDWEKT